MPLGALIGAGASLLGNVLSGNRADKAAKQNIQLQREFAQQGIRWKVEDAKAAGIHPLAALGAQTHSFSPVSIGGGGVGAGLAAAGQDISRAVNAMRQPDEKITAYEEALRALQLQRGQLENTLLASKIRTLNQPGNPPGLPGSEKLAPPQRTTSLRTPEGLVVTDPGLSDAQTMEDRWGEWVGDAYGVRNWGREVGDEMVRRAWENARHNFYLGIGPPSWITSNPRYQYRWHPLRR